LTTYYAQYPALTHQSLAILFPYLENLRDHLIRIDPASPFSGAAKGPTTPASRTSTNKDGAKKKRNNRATANRDGVQKESSIQPPAPTPHPTPEMLS
jgi:hypothetical protein